MACGAPSWIQSFTTSSRPPSLRIDFLLLANELLVIGWQDEMVLEVLDNFLDNYSVNSRDVLWLQTLWDWKS